MSSKTDFVGLNGVAASNDLSRTSIFTMGMRNNIVASNEPRMLSPAVVVQNACKTYSNGPSVLDNFSMTVERGTIYGLLGASGCGKTTILSCIVGLRMLDSGQINVFGARPGTKESGIPGKVIGYMPQEIALYSMFTIRDIIQYFGRIYDMTQDEINSRMKFLVNFLDLPDCSQIISSLSGGQQRRTSLAVAMIHQPELLILDEPTVGVDPLIREKIWEYLCEIVKRQTTVIITTHYIEEARQSNKVGLMRNGRMLVEKAPQTLLQEHNTNLLEDIVLKLCKKDNNLVSNTYSDQISTALAETSFYSRKSRYYGQNNFSELETTGHVVGLKYKSRSPDYDTLFRTRRSYLDNNYNNKRQSMSTTLWSHVNKIIALVIRNFITILRNPLFLILIIGLPTMQVFLMNLILGQTPINIKMGLVNNELKNGSLQLCDTRKDGCFNDNLSCTFINSFSDFKWNAFSSEEEALKSVQLGKSWGYLSIPSNFTQHMKDRSLWKNFITNDTIDGTTITARLDMSESVQREILIGSLLDKYLKFLKKMVSDCGGDPQIVDLPLKFNPVYGSLYGGMMEFVQPSQIILIIFLLPTANALSYVLDKKAGTMDRTMVAGVHFLHIFIAMVISEATLIFLELALCFGADIIICDFTSEGSWILIFLITLLTGIVGLSFGFVIGNVCSHEIEVMILILGSYLPMTLFSGALWPIQGNPNWLRKFCYLMPVTLPIESFRAVVSRGWGITHPVVWQGFASVAVWLTFFCALSVILLRFRN